MNAAPSVRRLPPLPAWSGVASNVWALDVAQRVRSTWPSVEAARSSGRVLALRVALWRAGVPFVHREKTIALAFSSYPEAARIVPAQIIDAVSPLSASAREEAQRRGCWFDCFVEREAVRGSIDVVVMSGLPGAGKDTWLRRNRPEVPTISLDALRAELSIAHGEEEERLRRASFERMKQHLVARQSFAWNSTLLRGRERRSLIDWLHRNDARVTLVSLEVSARVQAAQNRHRDAVVPEAALERMLSRWEPVLPGEAFAELFFEDAEPVTFGG
ncbi:MAG: AAA family ATPase [Archangium sp.]|nr:AAA family ATPase [Archangium sp.]